MDEFFLNMQKKRGLKGMAMTGHVSTFTLQSTFQEVQPYRNA